MNASSDNTSKKYKFAVVGNGLIGSAACRYLSEWSDSVVVIGYGEEFELSGEDTTENNGKTVFSSHYDEGRLCRVVSRDPVWHVLNGEAVRKYAPLEKKSGIRFHSPVGRLQAAKRSPEERQEFLDWMEQTKQQDSSLEFQYFQAGDRSWKETLFPMLDFPSECDVFFEAAPSGIINPRQLISAQNVISKQNGASILEGLVVNVSASTEEVTISLANGDTLFADKVLIACGAFTNFNNLLPEPIPLRYKTETTVWGTVTEETAKSLKIMPGVSYDIITPEGEPPDIDDLYMAPPLLYPDGTFKIKMGCNTIHESWPTTLEEIQHWFLHGNSDADLPAMVQALQSQLPEVQFLDFTSHRCIVTYTPSGYPTIDSVPGDPSGRLFVATGGNGTSAQGSDTLGHLAAGFLWDGRWILEEHGIPRDVFRATDNSWGGATKKLSKAQQRAMAVAVEPQPCI